MAQVITGRVCEIIGVKQGISRKTGDTWMSQEFVVETQGAYPRKVCFQIWGEEKINEMLPEIGDVVDVHYEIESREFKGSWYTTVKAWKVKNLNSSQGDVRPKTTSRPTPPPQPQAPAQNTAYNSNFDDDDMPF